MEKDHKLPCLNCIALPMCKGTIIDHVSRGYSPRYITLVLYRKCSLLYDYTRKNSGNFESASLLDYALDYISNMIIPPEG